MKPFKFRVGQTVGTHNNTAKIIHRWHGKTETYYDVKQFHKGKTVTWTYLESELVACTAGGITPHTDDAVEVTYLYDEAKNLVVEAKVWILLNVDGELYEVEQDIKSIMKKAKKSKKEKA